MIWDFEGCDGMLGFSCWVTGPSKLWCFIFDSWTRINTMFHAPTEHLAVHGTLNSFQETSKMAGWSVECGIMQQPNSLSLFHWCFLNYSFGGSASILPFDIICRGHLDFVVQTVAVHPSSPTKETTKRIILWGHAKCLRAMPTNPNSWLIADASVCQKRFVCCVTLKRRKATILRPNH